LAGVPCTDKCRCTKGASSCNNQSEGSGGTDSNEQQQPSEDRDSSEEDSDARSSDEDEDAELYGIRGLLDRKIRGSGPRGGLTSTEDKRIPRLLVQWDGHGDDENSWEPPANINECVNFVRLHAEMCARMKCSSDETRMWLAEDLPQDEAEGSGDVGEDELLFASDSDADDLDGDSDATPEDGE
jgi:hypothetical protein